MGTVVVDSSVVLGWLDAIDAHHQGAVAVLTRYIHEGMDFDLPATVVSEVLVAQARIGPETVTELRVLLDEMFGPVRPVDEDAAVRAAELRARHRTLRLPDALVIAVGQLDDAEVILTADKRWAAVDDRVEVLG